MEPGIVCRWIEELMISKSQLKKMRRNGMTDLEIATQLDVTPKEVFRSRRKHGLLTDEETVHIRRTRRNLIIGGIVGAVLVSGGLITYHFKKPVTYEDALRYESKRQTHIDQIVQGKTPHYVISVKYATPNLLEKLAKHGYTPSEDVFAATIPVVMGEKDDWQPVRPEHVGKGIKSIVVVYQSVYKDWHKKFPGLERSFPREELYKDMEVILRNVLLENEFTDARHFSEGIPHYPIDSFRNSKGIVNFRLFNTAIDLLSNRVEYKAIVSDPRTRTSPFLQEYANGLLKQVATAYSLFLNPEITKDMDPRFIEKLRQDFNPNKL